MTDKNKEIHRETVNIRSNYSPIEGITLSPNDQDILARSRDDLNEIITSGDWQSVGIYRFLNRILLIFLQQTALTLYCREYCEKDKRFRFREIYTSFADTWSYEAHAKQLKKLEDDFLEVETIRVYNTNFYLLVQKIVRDDDQLSKRRGTVKTTFYTDDENDDCCYNIVRVLLSYDEAWEEDDDRRDRFFEYIKGTVFWDAHLKYVDVNLTDRIRDRLKNKGVEEYVKPNEDIRNTNYLLPNIPYYFSENAIDPIYHEFKVSPLLRGATFGEGKERGYRPTNIVFFIRTYENTSDKSEKRYFDCYDYNVRIIIPTEQRREFKRTFLEIAKVLPTKRNVAKNWKFAGEGKEKKHFEDYDYIALLKKQLEKDDGIDRLIELLVQPYSKYTRSFIDGAFSSGFLYVRRTPLVGKLGLDRIQSDVESVDSEDYKNLSNSDQEIIEKEKVKIAALYYLFSVMAPEMEAEGHVSCIVKPLRIASSPWLCMATFTEFRDKNTDQYLNWQCYHHFYHSVAILAGRFIRRAVMQAYLDRIRFSVINAFNTAHIAFQNNPSRSYSIFLPEQLLNHSLDTASKIFPFPRIVANIIKKEPAEKSDNVIQYRNDENDIVTYEDEDGTYLLTFELQKNEYYPDLLGTHLNQLINSTHVHIYLKSGFSWYVNHSLRGKKNERRSK